MSDMTKRQHYVPQCYLKEFSIDKINIGAFVKSNYLLKSQIIRNVCKIDHFYTLKAKKEVKQKMFIESLFAKEIETRLSKVLKFLNQVNVIEQLYIESSYKPILAEQIVYQILRMPTYREKKVINDYLEIERELQILLRNSCIKDLEICLTHDDAEIHASEILNNSKIKDCIDDIVTGKYTILWTNEEIFTSDDPIIIIPFTNIPVSTNDYLEFFQTIYYPIGPNRLLKVEHCKEEDNYKDIYIELISSNELLKVNKLIFKKANQYVFSRNNFFGLNETQIQMKYLDPK